MDTTDVIAILALVVFGLVAGFFVARHSKSRQQILGGPVARALNYAASTLLISMAPTVLTMVIFIHPSPLYVGTIRIPPFVMLIGLVLGMMGSALLLLMVYALLEAPKHSAASLDEDRGWTEQDARSSGL